MNPNLYIICIAAIALLAVPALADSTATIGGGVYSWDTFEILENAVIEVNSTPSQSIVAKYGVYSFELEPGDYLITASYYQNSTMIYSAEESVKVKGEGSYKLDLLLLPVYSKELMDSTSEGRDISESSGNVENSSIIQSIINNSDSVNNADVDSSNVSNVNITETSETDGGPTSLTGYYLLAALVLSIFVAGGYSLKKHNNEKKSNPENDRLERSLSETNKLEKSSHLEGKVKPETAKPETENLSVPVSTPELSAKEPVLTKVPDEKVELKTEPGLASELIETQVSEESEFKEKEKGTESEDGKSISELEPIASEQEIEENKKISVQEAPEEKISLEETPLKGPELEPEPAELSGPETPVIKRNLPLPADLQEIMDIIRGQGGRITQKDLRSKLKYSEGKVSLMLADLERRELIEKFKRGRGNIIILRDEER